MFVGCLECAACLELNSCGIYACNWKMWNVSRWVQARTYKRLTRKWEEEKIAPPKYFIFCSPFFGVCLVWFYITGCFDNFSTAWEEMADDGIRCVCIEREKARDREEKGNDFFLIATHTKRRYQWMWSKVNSFFFILVKVTHLLRK